MWTPHREKDLLISFFIAITIVITIHYHFNQLNVQFIHSLWLAMKTKRFFSVPFIKIFRKKYYEIKMDYVEMQIQYD